MRFSRRAFVGFSAAALASASEAVRAPYRKLAAFVEPGHDEFTGEKQASLLRQSLNQAISSRSLPLHASATGKSPMPARYRSVAPDLQEAEYSASDADIASGWRKWVSSLGQIRSAQVYVLPANQVRFEVASKHGEQLEYRVGLWHVVANDGQISEFAPISEHRAIAAQPWFRDVTAHAFRNCESFAAQLSKGIPYWRARLDPATGIDVYGSNGIAVGDIDGDGLDEIYVCQPGGLPNRLYKFAEDGTLVDLTDKWGVGILDDTSSALFLDLRNTGQQDLVLLRSSGPTLFLHRGHHYQLRADAFRFNNLPRGGFTGMASADYNRDGKLDLYLCCYVYFQSEAQYTYAAPYHDARNGPPNFLFRNELNPDGSGFFVDATAETGLDKNNDRFSFAPAWCDYDGSGWPSLYVANDFGRNNLYRNRSGHFTDVAAEAGVEDMGPGMSAAWFDYDGDGRPDLYVGNMWTDAGQRIIADPQFKPAQAAPEAYRQHTMGNSLFHNTGNGAFSDVSQQESAAFGRWAWSSGGHDLDNDGKPELAVACGMLTNRSESELDSFFWREVVAKSPLTANPSIEYESGWNAINQFLREDLSWNGHEPNVLHARRGNRFYDFSGVSGLDFAEDTRAFAVTDWDRDGKPDIILKSRLGPQVRVLQNNCAGSNHSIAFILRGTKSNRDAIGGRVRVDGQTKWIEAGSAFISQHSKTLLFGTGNAQTVHRVEVLWPSGLQQEFTDLRAGATYTITEESPKLTATPFRKATDLPSLPVQADNEMRLHDTWLAEPVPLPTKQPGPALFIVREATPEFEVFRRYLFDWRTHLQVPFPLLLNAKGEAVKVYRASPDEAAVKSDLALLQSGQPLPVLPFPGTYLHQPRRDFFKYGAAYLWAGDPERALVYLDKVLEQNPNNARVYVLAGQIHLESNRVEEAETAFRRALAIQPASVNAWIGLGDVCARQNKAAEAADNYRKALDFDAKSAEAANGLGLALAKQNRYDEARSFLQRAIEIRRNYPEAINNLAVLYTQQGQVNDAIAAWQYGIQVAPDDDVLYLNLGRTYVRLGDVEKARTLMQELLDRKPGNLIARRALQNLERR